MKFITVAAALAATCAAAPTIPTIHRGDTQTLYTIKLSPTETRQVTEAEKWELKSQGKNFIDITNHPSLDPAISSAQEDVEAAAVTFPDSITHQDAVKPLLDILSTDTMQANLEPFTKFQNRFYTSNYGAQSSAWLLQQVQKLITNSGASGVTVRAFNHSFVQSSVIATLPGASDKTIVMGAHQDSVNWKDSDRNNNRAPGADDDGSGVMTILEAMRVLLTTEDVKAGKQPNTIEFHFYAAEEGGLLGSEDVWQSYKSQSKNVKAMLQQDMTGYSKGTTDKGKSEVVGVITDYVDTGLTNFIKKVIDAYCDISYVETKCGYACSDHASASDAGYPSAFVFESAFGDDSPYIHTSNDTLASVDYKHMFQHAKLTVGFAYELAYATEL